MGSLYCHEINNTNCYNKVTRANQYICSAGHGSPGVGQKTFIFTTLLRRLDAAGNSASSPVLLIELATDPEKKVRELAAGNPRTPLLAKMILAKDKEVSVQKAALEIAIRDKEDFLLETLAQSRFIEVSLSAQKALEDLNEQI